MILLRHGQSHFNALFARERVDPGLHDPGLTPTGQAQAAAAASQLSGLGLSRIVASPYTRALQTAQIVAEILSLPVAVDPLVGERAAMSCDVGSPASLLMRDWPGLDLGHLPEIWWPEIEEPEAALHRRAAEFAALTATAPDRDRLLVVTHWGFIRALTGHEVGNAVHLRHWPAGG